MVPLSDCYKRQCKGIPATATAYNYTHVSMHVHFKCTSYIVFEKPITEIHLFNAIKCVSIHKLNAIS